MKVAPAPEPRPVPAPEPEIAGEPQRTAEPETVPAISLPFYVPPILLEGDEPSPAGRWTKPRRLPPAAEPPTPETTGLPEAYGTGELTLRARDPHWLYAHWDLSREHLRRYNALSADGRLALRVYRDTVSGTPVEQLRVHPESQHWFVHVRSAGASYVAELGYFRPDGGWVSVSQSAPVQTPVEGPSPESTVRIGLVPSPAKSLEHRSWSSAAERGSPAAPTEARAPASPQSLPSISEGRAPASPQIGQTREATGAPSEPRPAHLSPAAGPAGGALPAEAPAGVTSGVDPVSAPPTAPTPELPMSHRAGSIEPMAPQTASAPTQFDTPSVEDRTAPAVSALVLEAVSQAEWSPIHEQALLELILGTSPVVEASLSSEQIAAAQPRFARRIPEGITSPFPTGAEAQALPEIVSSPAELPPQAGPQAAPGFWFQVNAELVIYGATEPTAAVSIGGRRIRLRPDGTFSYRFALPDGTYPLDVRAQSTHGDVREARLRFSRSTQHHGEVGTHPQDSRLKPPLPENLP